MTVISETRPSSLEGFKDRLWEAAYQRVESLRIEAWTSKEPHSFEDRKNGDFATFGIGDNWGVDLFDCAWFRFVAKWSGDIPENLHARIDINGELLVVDLAGQPHRSLTNKKSEFARCHGLPGKDVVQVVDWMLDDGEISFWADCAYNDLFGGLQGGGCIEVLELCERRDDIRSLYYDVEVLLEILVELSADKELCKRIEFGLLEAMARTESNFSEANIAAAAEILQPFFAKKGETIPLKISAVGHGHLDLAWLWPIRESIRKGARTLSTALANAELYPEHLFGCSQPQLFKWMKDNYPELYQRVKQGVEANNIELQGKFWVEPDCNLPNGESYVRQVLQGARFFEQEFGYCPDQCWQPDVFGYNGQLPQILKKTGHDAFMTQKLSWNVVNRFPHHSFNWEGIDGSVIPTHMLAEETYNGPAAPRSLRKIRDDYAQRDVSNHALMVFGIGDGGAGPGQEHLERIRRLKHFETLPEVEIRPTREFFQDWLKDADEFPCWKGELYLERHQGTFTTQALTKKNNRRCEILLREAEFACVLAYERAGVVYPAEELDKLWQDVLLFQFHDILPGSSIKRVYDECAPRYAEIIDELELMIQGAYSSCISSSKGDVLVNSRAFSETTWIEYNGVWSQVTVPGCSWIPVEAALTGLPIQGLHVSDEALENDKLLVRLNKKGLISAIRSKENDQEFVGEDALCNQFFAIPDHGDAWDYDTDYPNKNALLYLNETRVLPERIQVRSFIDGPRAVIEQSFKIGQSSAITQKIILESGSGLIEFDTVVDWQDTEHMLRVEFPVDVASETARFEIPFGSLSRPTHESDSFSRAQFEVPAQQWVDLSQEDRGVALYNDCKYGYRIKGNRLDMALIRCVPHPSCAVITVDDSGKSNQCEKEFTDLGEHRFKYALQPHAGGLSEEELTNRARSFNSELRIVSPSSDADYELTAGALISLTIPGVELVAVKLSENKAGVICRLSNVLPSPTEGQFRYAGKYSKIAECSMLEEIIETIAHEHEQGIHIRMKPFEVKTIYVELKD